MFEFLTNFITFGQEFHLDELLTHEISLQDIDKAFEMLKQPDCLKIVIKIQ